MGVINHFNDCDMERRWVKRNINLDLLSEFIAGFFVKKGFKLKITKQARQYRILALPKSCHELCEEVNVIIEGSSNDFTVKFLSGVRSHMFVRFGWLTTLFGGGTFLLRGLRSEEFLEKLEREFWGYLEWIVNCSGSFNDLS